MLLIAFLAPSLFPAAALAGGLEGEVESGWRGAWVLTTVEMYSDCAGIHTNNRVNGRLVQSKGRFRFKAGELAQVQKADLKRSRLDLLLTVPEPLLVSYTDGPFTLYKEIRCLAEMEVELPRQSVSGGDVARIDGQIRSILARFASEEEATRSTAWNGREREPYPEDYDNTLAEHAAWQAEQANAGIQARIARAREETGRITDRVSSDKDYLHGFALGIELVRGMDLKECNDYLSREIDKIAPQPPATASILGDDATARFQRGYQDGARLLFGLDSIRTLPGCLVPVPPVPGRPASKAR
jgi:hypothetical protein